MTSHDEQRLSDALRRQAESADPTLLTLDDVTSRARGIRRRRIASGVVAAAAVVAVVVPTGLVAANRSSSTEPPIATTTPTATATGNPTGNPSPSDPTTTPPTGPTEVSISGELPVGAAPAIPISIQGSVLTTEGERIEFGDELTYFAQVGEAYAGLVRTSDTGEAEFQVRTSTGAVVTKAPANIDGALAVTPDHTAVAYVGTDRRIHVWSDSDNDLTFSDELQDIRLVGMTNTEPGTCKEPAPEGPGCTVVFARGGEEGGAGYATSHGIVDDIAGFTTVRDVNDGVLAGQTKSTLEGSCNEVRLGFDGKALWKTCDASPINLSPGNEHVTALPAYFEGMCCSVYSVFDVAAGAKVLDVSVESDRNNMGYIPVMGWEDDTHVLAVAYTDDGWRVVRVGLDGSAEIADAGDLPTTDLGEVPIRTPVGS